MRVAGFSVLALVAFTVAFALAAQGAHCGPGCDAFGTVFVTGAHGGSGLLARPLDHRPQAFHDHRRPVRLPGHRRLPWRLGRPGGHHHHDRAAGPGDHPAGHHRSADHGPDDHRSAHHRPDDHRSAHHHPTPAGA